MKILLVSDHYPPFIGGAHRQTQLLARELHDRGHNVAVATVWHGGFPAVEDEAGVKVYRLKQLRTLGWIRPDRKQRHQPPFPDPVTIIGLRKLIDQFQPEVIHSYGWISYSCAAALTGRNIPLLVSGRDYAYSCANQTLVMPDGQVCSGPSLGKCMSCAASYYGAPKGWITTLSIALGRGLLKRKISGIHSISTYVQQIFHRDFLRDSIAGNEQPASKIMEAIIPSFREDEHEKAVESSQPLETWIAKLPHEPFILFVGALRRVKGVYQLLDAYQQLKSPPPLVLIGTVEFDSPRQVPPGVSILQDFPHQAVMAAWGLCKFGVIPSLWPEPLGSVVYEGMSKGKAMIGTTPGGHTDMIKHNETGLLVPAGDTHSLAVAMQRLIDDPHLCRMLGEAGFERSKAFTAGVAVPRFEDLYARLISTATSILKGQPL